MQASRVRPLVPSTVLLAGLALGLGTVPTVAQTLYTLDSSFVHEQVGGQNACNFPNGPSIGSLNVGGALPCGLLDPPTLNPFPAAGTSMLGDVAFDRVRDLLYVTDGTRIAVFGTNGVAVRSFTLASSLPAYHGQITGLGFDGPGGLLWITNGSRAAAVLPDEGCAAPTVIYEFPLPAAFAPYQDLDWHPQTATIFAAGTNGNVSNLHVWGASAPNSFNALAMAPSVVPPYTGLAIDTSVTGTKYVIYLTDGTTIEQVDPQSGGAFTPTFHWPTKSAPVAYPGTNGLAWTAHPIPFGTTSSSGPPLLGARGNSVSPNPNFVVRITGAVPGHIGLVYYSLGTFCPPPNFLGGKLYITAPNSVGFGTIPASGDLDLAVPLPPGMNLPTTVYSQGFVYSGFSWQTTNGLSLAISRP